MRTPVAPSTEMSSSSGEVMAISAARRARPCALGAAGAHERAAHAAHDRLHVGEVDVDDAVQRDEVADALDGLEQHLVGLAEGVDEGEVVVAEHQELLVRDRDERVDVLGELREAELGAARALPALEDEGLGHDADGERALFARELRDDRRRAGAGAAAHAGGDEDHVGAADELLDALHVFERRLATALGIRAGAEAARDARCRCRSWSGAALPLSACASVLTTMNSTPSRPKWIIVLTALPPEPPPPIDLDARLVFLRARPRTRSRNS